MTREPGQVARPRDPTELLITDIPRFELEQLEAALSAFIHWHTRSCVTRADRIKRDESFVSLRQAHWHLQEAVKKLRPAEMATQPWQRRVLWWLGRRGKVKAA